jgi:hypothetical protein
VAQYASLLGRRVEVYYRTGGMLLPATGTLTADSGKSIFLEEHYGQELQVKTFRWEIPYESIVKLTESLEQPSRPPLPSFP